MRKGYGPTDVSYHLPLEKFTEKVRRGIHMAVGFVTANGGDAVHSVPLPTTLTEDAIARIHKDADCMRYINGVDMVIPSFCA